MQTDTKTVRFARCDTICDVLLASVFVFMLKDDSSEYVPLGDIDANSGRHHHQESPVPAQSKASNQPKN